MAREDGVRDGHEFTVPCPDTGDPEDDRLNDSFAVRPFDVAGVVESESSTSAMPLTSEPMTSCAATPMANRTALMRSAESLRNRP
jgi:hypothetical protein